MRPHLSRRLFFVFFVLIISSLLAWILFASKHTRQAEYQETHSKPVKTLIVSPVPFQPTETFPGMVRGIRQTDIQAETTGTIVSLLKEPGETVRLGETLATLQSSDTSAFGRSASLSLEAAEKSLRTTKDYYVQKVDEAEAGLEKVEENKRNGDTTQKDVAAAEESVRSVKRLRDTEIARAEAEVAAAQGGVFRANASAEHLVIKAPFAGVIVSKIATLGSFVSPGAAVYTIASSSEIEIKVSVPARVALSVTKGTSVDILSENIPEPIKGKVFSVARAVSEQTNESIVVVRPEVSKEGIMPILGQYTDVRFPVRETASAILIPETSVVHTYDDTFVMTIENGVAKKRAVILGGSNEINYREVISGINSGEEIVTEGLYTLQENTNVQPYAAQ